jgi:cysteinyl-tRNA synthetase
VKLYNTLTQKKEEFKTINKNKVLMYVCGPTVYDYLHIGNARPYVVFDTLRRYFEYKNFEVVYVQNFTDVDDKIINRARQENVDTETIANKFLKAALEDAKNLNIKESINPRATENIDVMIKMISELIEKKFAYEINGAVYFDTSNIKNYGKLSKKNIDELIAGSRVDIDDNKKNIADFILWKPYKNGEPKWNSPWGFGRPGWHIECSAMVKKYLGDTIDIHAGGEDLIFPHHENEIAQSEACNQKPFANFWLHNGFINIDNAKMSKSKNNFFTIREVADKFSYEVIRFFILSVHYRSPINFSDDALHAAESSLERIKTCLINIDFFINKFDLANNNYCDENKFKEKFIKEMENDFNTAGAIGVIFDLVRFINKKLISNPKKYDIICLRNMLLEFCNVLGLKFNIESKIDADYINELIEKRKIAKENKNWELADKIRNEIMELGIILEDTPNGVRWFRK